MRELNRASFIRGRKSRYTFLPLPLSNLSSLRRYRAHGIFPGKMAQPSLVKPLALRPSNMEREEVNGIFTRWSPPSDVLPPKKAANPQFSSSKRFCRSRATKSGLCRVHFRSLATKSVPFPGHQKWAFVCSRATTNKDVFRFFGTSPRDGKCVITQYGG